MILSGLTIEKLEIVRPTLPRTKHRGMSYGLSFAGYDIRAANPHTLEPNDFALASSVEEFVTPLNVLGTVRDKSTWARRGLSVFNTVIEPGWRGFLTLELFNAGYELLEVRPGDPIAQVVFEFVDRPVDGYDGKYQDQGPDPQLPLFDQ